MNETKKRFTSLADVMRANKNAGRYWFSKDTMRFFNTKLESEIIGGKYFISSNQFISSEGHCAPREYKIQEAMSDGAIKTVDNAYKTPEEALEAVKEMLN